MIKLDVLKKESLILFPDTVNVKNIWLRELSNSIIFTRNGILSFFFKKKYLKSVYKLT